jgi:hypothetical protein
MREKGLLICEKTGGLEKNIDKFAYFRKVTKVKPSILQ